MLRLLCVALLVCGSPAVQAADKKEDPAVAVLKARLEAQEKELQALRKRNEELEKERLTLIADKEAALRNARELGNQATLAKALMEDYAKKLVEATAKLKGPNPAAPADTIRGAVEEVSGTALKISVGVDAGLEPGSMLDVYRTEGKDGARYLGTIKITSVRPKSATGEFSPARKVPVAQLRPEELPRKGDEVGRVAPK